jgi:hypothetical protein
LVSGGKTRADDLCGDTDRLFGDFLTEKTAGFGSLALGDQSRFRLYALGHPSCFLQRTVFLSLRSFQGLGTQALLFCG